MDALSTRRKSFAYMRQIADSLQRALDLHGIMPIALCHLFAANLVAQAKSTGRTRADVLYLVSEAWEGRHPDLVLETPETLESRVKATRIQ